MATLAIFPVRRLIDLTGLLLVMGLSERLFVVADEGFPIAPGQHHSVQSSPLHSDRQFHWLEFSSLSQPLRIEMPPQSRVSHSRRPLRQVVLTGGDRFYGELLEWGRDRGSFRLLTGRAVPIPAAAIALLTNPPAEIDLIDESFEADLSLLTATTKTFRVENLPAPDGQAVLQLSETAEFEQPFPSSLKSARVEFMFKALDLEHSSGSGEWTLNWASDQPPAPRVTVRVGPNRSVQVTELRPSVPAAVQPLTLSEGWHSFLALVTPERTRLIVDDAILATFPTPECPLQSIRFQSTDRAAKNALQLDAFQVRRLDRPGDVIAQDESLMQDIVTRADGDELFGPVRDVERHFVRMEAFGRRQTLPWTQIAGLSFAQSAIPVRQTSRLATGIITKIELQPLTDRPDCEPEHWTGTIVRFDLDQVVLQQPLVGEVAFRWSDIRRIESQFFGQSLLIDARRFHLGNSIRPDFHRHQPDGTDLQLEASLKDVPSGPAHLTIDVAELEASGKEAPPASPFLAELRAGHLITEVFVNGQRVGDLNSQIRFKAKPQNPDRVRLAIPHGLLKIGNNSIRLEQRSKKDSPHELDDCELGNVRLEFGAADVR